MNERGIEIKRKKKKEKRKQLTTPVGEEVFRVNLWSVW